MLPFASDNGARLAAILPSCIASLARGIDTDAEAALRLACGPRAAGDASPGEVRLPVSLPGVRSIVLVVVDGLGQSVLKTSSGHARTLSSLPGRRIETVFPSTTGAALTTLTTGRLPGEHGLIGYRIRHPELGLLTTLRDWEGIEDPRSWQRARPLFRVAAEFGARPLAIGRPQHATGGLTEAILGGAEYIGGARIEDRFAAASKALRGSDPVLAYLYVDELDKAAHEHGWQSPEWRHRLEQLDGALDAFLRGLPGDVGVVVTADHGIVDVAAHQQVLLDADPEMLEGVAEIGGEPRMRSLYLHAGEDASRIAARWDAAEGSRAWVGTREEAVAADWFGPVDPAVGERFGDVVIAARKQVAYYLSDDEPRSRAMVGQHGSLTAEERGVPLLLAGSLAGTGFAAAVGEVAKTRAAS